MQTFQEQRNDIKNSLKVMPNANTMVRSSIDFTFLILHKNKYTYSADSMKQDCCKKKDRCVQFEIPSNANTTYLTMKFNKVNATKQKSRREIKKEAKNAAINKKRVNKELNKALKLEKSLITKVGIKSSKSVIEKEIKRLTIRLNSGKFEMPNVVRRVIKSFKDELTHRNSGIRRTASIVSGGRTGLKK